MVDYTAIKRYNVLWETAVADEHGAVVPTLEDPYVHGSLRPEKTSLVAAVGGELIRVTNLEAAFAEKAHVLSKLAQLESVVTLVP